MKMIVQFKEIDDFFKLDRFSDIDLIELRKLIKEKYIDVNSFKLANSLIDLQILKFEMEIVEESKENKTDSILEKTIPQNNKNQVQTKKRKRVGTEGMTISEKIEFLSDKSISYILNEITETKGKEYFLKILREKGYYKGRISVVLEIENYNEIKDLLITTLKSNKKRDPSKKIITNKKYKDNRSISKTNSVYDKIMNMNGTGKIIYIRSK